MTLLNNRLQMSACGATEGLVTLIKTIENRSVRTGQGEFPDLRNNPDSIKEVAGNGGGFLHSSFAERK